MTQPPRKRRLTDTTMRGPFNGGAAAKKSSPPSPGTRKEKAGGGRASREITTRLNWHVLGGNNQHRIGANCGMCVYDEPQADGSTRRRAVLFDAGVLTGDGRTPEHPALADCDTVIPDLTPYLFKRDNQAHHPDIALDSIFLTHSHADHVGALAFMIQMGYVLPKVYATPYTAKRLQQELAFAGIAPADWPQISMIAAGQAIKEGPVNVTPFWVSHSTPQSVGFFIETPDGNILNPGDFKLDQSVLWGPAFSQSQLERIIAGKGVDLLLLDSTGADRDVTPITEEDVRQALREVVAENPGKRIIVAVMSGFEENLASVARVAAESGRDLWVAGGSHEQSLDALAQTGLTLQDQIGMPLQVRVLIPSKTARTPSKTARDLAAAPPSQSIVVVTGAQGTSNAVLTRAADGTHSALTLDPKNDIVLFCAPSIPGQESGRYRLFSQLRQRGIPFLTRQDKPLYAHAHARLPELREMARLTNPKTIVPIHGDATLRAACAAAMQRDGHRVLPAVNGDMLRVSRTAGLTISMQYHDGQRLIGFKTLQGKDWRDRYYVRVRTSDYKKDDGKIAPATRTRIFNIS